MAPAVRVPGLQVLHPDGWQVLCLCHRQGQGDAASRRAQHVAQQCCGCCGGLMHTFDNACPACPGRGGQAGQCDHSSYSKRRLRFINAHIEAYTSAYLNPDPSAARNELERLNDEYRTMPSRHDCSCWPTHCRACAKLAVQRTNAASAVEAGRTRAVHAPMPMTTMLDVHASYADRPR